MKRKPKTMLMCRNVKTKQQVHREVEIRGVAFQTLAKLQSEYHKLKG